MYFYAFPIWFYDFSQQTEDSTSFLCTDLHNPDKKYSTASNRAVALFHIYPFHPLRQLCCKVTPLTAEQPGNLLCR